MKTKKKSKARVKHPAASRPIGMQRTKEVSKRRLPKESDSLAFTPMETGQPDQEEVVGLDNPSGVQGGRGPTNQEGEGERQNDQLAELQEIEPDIEDR